MQALRHFDCARFGLEIGSFGLRVLTGHDEHAALERAGGDASRFDITEQLVADAIARVDGQDVVRPYPWSDWSSKARSVVRAAFKQLHGAEDKDVAAFLATEAAGAFRATEELALAFGSISFRSMTGRDELAALRSLGADPSGYLVSETVLGAAVSCVDGTPVAQPFVWADWDLRTRAFVRAAHEKATSVTEEDLKDFLSGARPEAGAESEPA